MWGVRGRALPEPRLPALSAGCQGPLPTGCRCGEVRAWGPVTNPTARALASWLCALWGRHEGARGWRLLPGCGASGVGRSPTPDCPPSGRAAGARYPLAVGAGGCGRGDPSPTPQRALLRAVGAASGCPGGAPLAWLWGVRGPALSGPRLPALWAGCRGPLPTGCGCGGLRAWGPVTNPTARALASWLCALWGRHEGARGGRLLPGCGASGVGRSPTPDSLPSGRAAGAHYPLAVGAGGCGRGYLHQSHSARSRVLWGRHEGARGGPLLPGCGASGVGRSPSPDCLPSGRAAEAHYPLAVGAGGCGFGDPSPTPQRALLRAGFARCWGGMRVPGGGASCLGVGRPGSGALPPLTARHLGGLPGPTTHWLWVRGGAGGVTRHQPHSARSCELALRAVGAARGRPGGAPLAWVWGVRGRALSHLRLPALWAGSRGPLPVPSSLSSPTLAGCFIPRSNTNPLSQIQTPHPQGESATPSTTLRIPSATHTATPGGLSPPLSLPWGPVSPSLSSYTLVACSIPRSNTNQSSQIQTPHPQGESATPSTTLIIPSATHTATPGGLSPPLPLPRGPVPPSLSSSTLAGCSIPRSNTNPLSQIQTPHPQGESATRSTTLIIPSATHNATPGGLSLPLSLPQGPVPPSLSSSTLAGCSIPRSKTNPLSQIQTPHPQGESTLIIPSATHTATPGGLSPPKQIVRGCGCGGVRPWGPVTNTTARALASWLCALWGRHEGARAGRLLPGCGASGVGRSPTPVCLPSGRAAGAHYPLAVSAGGCGRGNPSPTPQRALLRPVGAA